MKIVLTTFFITALGLVSAVEEDQYLRELGPRRRGLLAELHYSWLNPTPPKLDPIVAGSTDALKKERKCKVKLKEEATNCRPIPCYGDDPKPCYVYIDNNLPNFYFKDDGSCCLVGKGDRQCTDNEIQVCESGDVTNCQQCGEQCDPSDCTPEACDETKYDLRYSKMEQGCMRFGKKKRKDTGKWYNWAVLCGQQTEVDPPDKFELENRAVREYDCMAFRLGAGYNKNTAHYSDTYPCQYLQWLLCGCGPLDMYFGEPTATCVPYEPDDDDDEHRYCPLTCYDQPKYVDKMCDSFSAFLEPGSQLIDFWEGENHLDPNPYLPDPKDPSWIQGSDLMFTPNWDVAKYKLKIYGKDKDSGFCKKAAKQKKKKAAMKKKMAAQKKKMAAQKKKKKAAKKKWKRKGKGGYRVTKGSRGSRGTKGTKGSKESKGSRDTKGSKVRRYTGGKKKFGKKT